MRLLYQIDSFRGRATIREKQTGLTREIRYQKILILLHDCDFNCDCLRLSFLLKVGRNSYKRVRQAIAMCGNTHNYRNRFLTEYFIGRTPSFYIVFSSVVNKPNPIRYSSDHLISIMGALALRWVGYSK